MAGKQKADSSALDQLKKDLKSGQLGSLYILHGEESYLKDYYLGEMEKHLLPKGTETFNLHTLEEKEVDFRALAEAVDCLPMMCERTMILVTDYDLFKAPSEQRDKLEELFGQLPDYACLVFYYDRLTYKPDSRTKLAAAIKKHGQTVELPRQEQTDLIPWICRRFRAAGKDIQTEDAKYLIFLCGDLMTALISEIDKIASFSPSNAITRADIDKIAIPQLDAVVFQMTDAIAVRDYNKAAAVLGDLFHMQQAPIMILSVLGKQMRQLYSARLALEHKKGAKYLAELWKMHPYPAEKLMNAAHRFDLNWCSRAVVRCAETDLAMKSTGLDGEELLIGLLMELACPC
jgi:DNA polymerase-3 subunit delta